MNELKKITLSLLVIFLSGCAVGPLVSHETARSVGKSHHEVIAGYGVASYVIKWNYGLTKNLDLGFQMELLSIGLRAKYSFINGQDGGWSLSSALGAGSSAGGSHQYLDLTSSYLFEKFEPYFNARWVHVKTDPSKIKVEGTGTNYFEIDVPSFNYGELSLGSRYWFSKEFMASLEGSVFVSGHSGVKVLKESLIGLGLGYRF